MKICLRWSDLLVLYFQFKDLSRRRSFDTSSFFAVTGLHCPFNGDLLCFVLRLFCYVIFSVSFLLLVLLLLLKSAILCIGITWRDAFFFQGETLETVTTALVCLCSTQQSLLDHIPQLGYINKVFSAMSAHNNAIPKAAIQLAHQFSSNEVPAHHSLLVFSTLNTYGSDVLLFSVLDTYGVACPCSTHYIHVAVAWRCSAC